MRLIRWISLITVCFLAAEFSPGYFIGKSLIRRENNRAYAAGFSLGEFLGGALTKQEYNKTYKEEYKKARDRGMSEKEADRYARGVAEEKAGKRKQMIEGSGAILGSTGEIDYESEMTIGESIALEGFKRYGVPVKDDRFQRYVNILGNAIARNSVRPDILYRFVVIDSPLYNAFSCPGGIIFVTSTLLKSMENESQLAGVLAHEVSHVGHRHALKSIKRAKFFEGVGKITAASMKGDKGKEFQGVIGDLQTVLFDKGLDKAMEFEADLSGMEAAYRTGYDPSAMVMVLKALQEREARATKEGSWFSTHPPLRERIEKCQSAMSKYPDAKSLAKQETRFASYLSKLP
jgi:predicted Zn-dependent protease